MPESGLTATSLANLAISMLLEERQIKRVPIVA
jgi:hypothetical protein